MGTVWFQSWQSSTRTGWVTLDEVSGSSLPVSVSNSITIFLPFLCRWEQQYFAAQHTVTKDNAKKLWLVFYLFLSHDDSSEPAPLALSQLTTQEGKQTSQKSASKMLISMEGPKLKDTESESSTVIIVPLFGSIQTLCEQQIY